MKQHKVIDVHLDGIHLECIKTDDNRNPFRIYYKTFNHRYLLVKYGDFLSASWFIYDFYRQGMDSMTLPEIRQCICNGQK